MTKWVIIAGGILSATSIIIGAFGAHALKAVLEVKAMGWIETGVTYQSTHALALIACGLVPAEKGVGLVASLFIAGIALFSGSLYLMALTGVTTLGIITPIGGVLLISGWLAFCWLVWSQC